MIANAYIARQRLEYFEDMLLATAWTRVDADGWLAPEHFRDLLGVDIGRGSVHLWTAVAAQVQYDHSVIREADAREAAAQSNEVHSWETELQEVADGAYGDNPAVRGEARDRLAARRLRGEAQASREYHSEWRRAQRGRARANEAEAP